MLALEVTQGDGIKLFDDREQRAPRSNRGAQLNFPYRIVVQDNEDVIDGQTPASLLDGMRNEVAAIVCKSDNICRNIGVP